MRCSVFSSLHRLQGRIKLTTAINIKQKPSAKMIPNESLLGYIKTFKGVSYKH